MWHQCVVELLKFVKMRRVDYILRNAQRINVQRELAEKNDRVQQWLSSTRPGVENREPPQHGKRKRQCSHVEQATETGRLGITLQ